MVGISPTFRGSVLDSEILDLHLLFTRPCVESVNNLRLEKMAPQKVSSAKIMKIEKWS